ncbi:hypothetical protein H7Y40_02535 [Pedobacter sp.]|nr:hypothetical protein [Candidatus Saccharibacteria bacterium]
MKKNEVALLILIVSVVALDTYFVINAAVGKAAAKAVIVERADAFTTKLVPPSTTIFNKDAINPTVKVKIGDQSGQQPFTINQ